MQNRQLVTLGILFFFVLVVWAQVYEGGIEKNKKEDGLLTVAYLDVGQGDAIYIEAPNGRQMVIDGGPKETLMMELPTVMPFGDKTIDVMMVTNPDLDHYSGFIPLLEQYDIATVVEPGTHNDFGMYATLQQKIRDEDVEHVLARSGQRIILDQEKNVYFEILFPDRNVSSWDSNDGSIVGRLVYGDISFLFTGDSTLLTEGIVVANNDISGIDVLKVGHHGSKTSTGVPLLREASPEYAVISAGAGNRYGHPTKLVLDRLASFGVETLTTIDEGTIVFETDGKLLTRVVN
jgi:competence protein ComEC